MIAVPIDLGFRSTGFNLIPQIAWVTTDVLDDKLNQVIPIIVHFGID